MNELQRQLHEIKELLEKGLLTKEEYTHIRRQLLKHLEIKNQNTTPPKRIRPNHNLRAVPDPVAVADGARWTSNTSIGRNLPMEGEEHISNETIIPMGMFDEYNNSPAQTIIPETQDFYPQTIVPNKNNSPSQTIVPESNDYYPQTIVPDMNNPPSQTIVPFGFNEGQTIVPDSVSQQPPAKITQNVALITGEGTYMEESYLLCENRVTIGRAQHNHLIIYDDPTVSRIHCEIYHQQNCFFINDNNSIHGTYLNSERVYQRAQLSDEDEIQIGNTKIRFRFL